MSALKGSCTNWSLWFAAVGSFVVILGVGVVLAAPLDKITICHHNHNTITVSENALAAHLRHGDTAGACGGDGTNCACNLIFDPVTCTSDGKTYVNLCNALCAGARGCTRNGDSPACACSQIFDPVRCENGTLWANQCVATCGGETVCTPIRDQGNCACTTEFNPVTCNSDGATYANLCIALCAGASGCGEGCPCDNVLDPVTCESNQQTYGNLCQARCDGATGCVRGGGTCACSDIFDPVVCSSNCGTYANLCVALCAGASGCNIPGSCACDQTYDPVTCDSDGRTYANLCTAICSGATGCIRPVACPRIFDPVICNNGITYNNLCLALGDDQTAANCAFLLGGGPCACDHTENPVTCSSDGQTYANICIAGCVGAQGCVPGGAASTPTDLLAPQRSPLSSVKTSPTR
jgi:hypothetical protein